ncbi:hypothetical protein WKK05_02650 [Nostoc sp. UHCC 0302]
MSLVLQTEVGEVETTPTSAFFLYEKRSYIRLSQVHLGTSVGK